MTNINSPKISAIVPVYNVELFIDRCLNSIIGQTFTDFEVILVDDNSPDNCPEICEKYANSDNRIKVIHNKVNQGLPQSRKIGINNASGTYIQFIDSDDWVEKNMFERLYLTAISNDYDIVWHDFFDFDDSYRKQNIESLNKTDIYKKLFDYKSRISSVVWNKFTKKDILLQVNFPKAMQWEDIVITVQSIGKANKIKYLPEAFYHHTYNKSSISQSKKRKIKGLSEIIENLTISIDYCREYLGHDFIRLEPELSACANRFKFESIFVKELRYSDVLSKLYPESETNIFNKAWITGFYKRLFLYLYIKKLPGFSLFLDLLKCVKY